MKLKVNRQLKSRDSDNHKFSKITSAHVETLSIYIGTNVNWKNTNIDRL